MKKIAIVALVLAMLLTFAACGCKHEWLAATCENPKTCELCGETEGEAKGHSIVVATCEEAEHCENCNYQYGEPLGHTWVEATTESPKTCETCGATEGERIITDERFTTAATKELHGEWRMEIPIKGEDMGMAEFPEGASMFVTLYLSNSGEMNVDMEISDNFDDILMLYMVEAMYAAYAEQGLDAATADAMFESQYGMDMQAYVEQTVSDMNMDQVLASILGAVAIDGVYYAQDGLLYTGESWEEELVPEGYTVEGDTLTMESFTEMFGEDYVFIRVAE